MLQYTGNSDTFTPQYLLVYFTTKHKYVKISNACTPKTMGLDKYNYRNKMG